jgi:hypothetical protein
VEGFKDLSLREAWVIAPVMVVIVALGVYPKPILDFINPSVQSTNSVVRNHDPAPSVPEFSPTNAVCEPHILSYAPVRTSGAYSSSLTIKYCGSSK